MHPVSFDSLIRSRTSKLNESLATPFGDVCRGMRLPLAVVVDVGVAGTLVQSAPVLPSREEPALEARATDPACTEASTQDE